jgi:hypothetical protein
LNRTRGRNNTFTDTNCNLGRFKSSHSIIEGNVFRNAKIPSLELAWLPQVRKTAPFLSNFPMKNIAWFTMTGSGPTQWKTQKRAVFEFEWLLQFFEGPVMLENVSVVGNHIQGEGKQPIHCGPGRKLSFVHVLYRNERFTKTGSGQM